MSNRSGGLTISSKAKETVRTWIEAEVQWPDGRRAFATNTIAISATAAPELTKPQIVAGGGLSFQLAGGALKTYVIQASPELKAWTPIATNTLPANGVVTVTDLQAASFSERYYCAFEAP